MNQINIQYYKTKYAYFILGSFENKLCLLDFRYRKMRTDEYFDMRRKVFGMDYLKYLMAQRHHTYNWLRI